MKRLNWETTVSADCGCTYAWDPVCGWCIDSVDDCVYFESPKAAQRAFDRSPHVADLNPNPMVIAAGHAMAYMGVGKSDR